ncbi:uncharacterized protein PG986_008976 [Apiospora aurea]|uniref:Uncharacterized protein n=1 Tax=Apiospora aurea TaxID=335848 RepID=A0ABR1Q6A9_9PEZI
MVKLAEVQTLNAALAADSPKPLVAVFLGGTSGIGHMTARALASSAQQAGGARVDYLMTSQGEAIFQPRKDTTEGLDETMAILGTANLQVRSHLCYMHSMYMSQLAELHRAEKQLRLVHVFPGLVLTPAFHNPAYSAWFRFLFNGVLAPLFLAPFVAVDPVESGERMLSLASPALYPAASMSGTGDDSSSSRGDESGKGGTVRGMDGRPGSGAYSLDWKGDDTHNQKVYAKLGDEGIEALKEQVWEHTNTAFEDIAAGKPFTE